tara:strand:- start:2372 stop:3145 length:774 start_codon:yes stop_codon:yes gene_type:complete
MNHNDMIKIASEAALMAGEEIMKIYNDSEFIDFKKKKDNSPLTKADRASHNIISKILKNTKIEIISEEKKIAEFDKRKKWKYYWLVDPLDGTKEFIKKNGEFTVNIALIKNNIPYIGIVYCPTFKTLYWNDPKTGSYKKHINNVIKLKKREEINFKDPNLRVVTSRSHMNEETEGFLTKLNKPQIVPVGSSLKILFLAENNADIYPRYGPTMEWDTAAAHAIANGSNVKLFKSNDKSEISYNKKNLLNPFFLAYPKD